MVEVLAAILIFGILIGGIASMQSTTLNLIRNNRHRAVAANLAAEEMDTVRSTAFENLPVGQAVTTRTVDTVVYTVTRESEWIPRNASAGACDAPSGSDPAYLRVNVSVTWPVMSGTAPVDAHTIITPPVGTYDEDLGHVAVRVLDRDAQPVSGVQIALSGTESASQFTNSDGCVFFAFLTPGPYTATASAAGYVSDQGVASPSQPVSVVQGAISSLLFPYDRAATLSLTPTGKDASAPAPANVPLVLFNTSILPTGLIDRPGTGIPRSVDGLFPYASGYIVWAGSCTDADPAAHVDGTRPDAIAVEPGLTTTGSVLMPEVLLEVTQGGLPAEGVSVVANHAADPGCPAGETYTVGATDAAGQLQFALPYGAWALQIGSTDSWNGTLSPTDPTGPTIVTVAKP
jgi:Tfp pilus assembly protein PilV